MPVAPSNISVKTVDGLTVYAVFRHVSDLTAWNTFTSALESFQAGHWYSGASNNYAVAATKSVQSANVCAEYAVQIPSMGAGVYFAELYVQQGATPAVTDGQPSWVVQDIAWNGFAILPSISVSGNEIMDVSGPVSTTYAIKKNTALSNFEFPMYASGTNTPTAGYTVTGTVSLDGAAFTSLTNAVTELSNGLYKINLAAADTNASVFTLKFTANGADPTLVTVPTQT